MTVALFDRTSAAHRGFASSTVLRRVVAATFWVSTAIAAIALMQFVTG